MRAWTALGERSRTAEVYEALLPYAEVNVVAGIGTLCLGSAARHLGKMAAVLGRRRDAADHFERALEANSSLRSPVLVAHTLLDWAGASGTGARAQRMIDEAAATADRLGLVSIARRAAGLRGR